MGGLFGSPPAPPPPPPPPPPPAPMPTPDDSAIKAAQKKQAALSIGRSGRLSTILSDDSGSDKLGG